MLQFTQAQLEGCFSRRRARLAILFDQIRSVATQPVPPVGDNTVRVAPAFAQALQTCLVCRDRTVPQARVAHIALSLSGAPGIYLPAPTVSGV